MKTIELLDLPAIKTLQQEILSICQQHYNENKIIELLVAAYYELFPSEIKNEELETTLDEKVLQLIATSDAQNLQLATTYIPLFAPQTQTRLWHKFYSKTLGFYLIDLKHTTIGYHVHKPEASLYQVKEKEIFELSATLSQLGQKKWAMQWLPWYKRKYEKLKKKLEKLKQSQQDLLTKLNDFWKQESSLNMSIVRIVVAFGEQWGLISQHSCNN